jgi:hypothetical protein
VIGERRAAAWRAFQPSAGFDDYPPHRRGRLGFVPRNTTHGTVSTTREPLWFLAIITPRFNLAKDIVWSKPPAFQTD